MTIKDFSEGLITRVHPQLIPISSSVKYTNCNNEKLTLCPIKDKVEVSEVKKRWEYNIFCDSIVDSDEEMYFTDYGNIKYAITPDTTLQKFNCDGTLSDVGIAKPENLLVLTSSNTGGAMCGDYSYVYTYYDSNTGYESAPNPLAQVHVDKLEPAINVPNPAADALIKEKTKFVGLVSAIESIRNTDMSTEAKLESLKCLVDKYDWTIQRFIDFKTNALAIYDNADSVVDKYNAIMCLADSYPEGIDIKGSYAGIVNHVRAISESENYNDAEKLDIFGCILGGANHAVEAYDPRYHELVDLLIAKLQMPYPADAYVPEDEWRLLNIQCILNETVLEDNEEEETPVATCEGSVVITGILQSLDPNVTNIRLYRLGGDLTVYSLVVELPNITQTYTDTAADSDIAGNHVLDSFSNIPAPIGSKYLTDYNAMIMLANDNKLVFSDVDKPYAFPPTNTITFSETLTGMGTVQNGLLVFTKYRTYIVVGNSPVTLTKYLISDEQGCVNHDTIAFNNNQLYWLSTDGICVSSGGNVQILTQDRLGRLDIKDSINATVFDRMYFLSRQNGNTLVLDNRYGFCIREIETSGWFGVYKDVLHVGSDGTLYDMFSGDTLLPMHYVSPIFSEGRLSEYKMFKDVYIAFRGDIHVKVYIYMHNQPRELVFDYDLLANQVQEDLKLKGNIMGYGIQFEITGTGCVEEIDFKAVTGRENGK